MLWIFWIVFILVAIGLANERTLYQDSAFGLFRICNNSYTVDHGRYGILALLGPVWLFSKLSLPLGVLITVLSLTGVLIPLLTSVCINKISSKNFLYLIPVFLLTATGPEWFFLGAAEMVPALCFGAISMAFLEKSVKWNSPHHFGAVLSMILAFYTHPGVFPFLFAIPVIHFAIHKNLYAFISLGALGIIAIIKSLITDNSAYESEILNRFNVYNLTHFYTLWSWQYIKHHFSNLFLLPAATFILSLILVMRKSNVLQFFILISSAASSFLLLLAIFGSGDSNLMMEKNFAPFILSLLSPILFCSSKNLFQKRAVFIVATVVISIGLYQKWNASEFYINRLANLDRLISVGTGKGHEKILISAADLKPESWQVIWALPYETVLRSAARNNVAFTAKVVDSENHGIDTTQSGLFLGAEFAYPIHVDTMNRNYILLNKSSVYNHLRLSENEKNKINGH